MRGRFFAIFLIVTFGNELAKTLTVTPGRGNSADLISLYGENDPITELIDANVTQHLNDPQKVWFVEFYAHWCGHCQRFSPVWKQLAKEFDVPGWRGRLNFGAMNCAQQDCDAFKIQGTPTLKLYLGGRGVDIPATLDLNELRRSLLQQLEMAQFNGYLKSEKLPNLLLVSGLRKSLPSSKTRVAYILEDNNSGFLGREIVFMASKKHPQLEVMRMDWMYAKNSILSAQPLTLPAVITLPVFQSSPDWSQIQVISPRQPSFEKYRTSILNSIDEIMAKENIYTIIMTTTEKTTTTTTTTSSPLQIISDMGHNGEKVYMGDLEKALEYIVNKEIPATENLDELQLRTVYQFLENVVRYLPLRPALRHFLLALRDWPLKMEFTAVSGQHYAQKVDELNAIYRPFESTPSEYRGCRGSKPQFRGYPCSLWQLFHSLMVNAAIKGDPSMALGGHSTVAKNMVDYVHYFFSCRDCAQNFRGKINRLGFLPSNERDSIVWLWQIHNMANAKLKGDSTEDPEHPKIIWPSSGDCPKCRSDRRDLYTLDPQIAFVENQLWNLTALVNHHVKVYGREQLVQTNDLAPSEAVTSEVLDRTIGEMDQVLQSLKETSANNPTLLHDNLQSLRDFCIKHSNGSVNLR